MYYTKVYKHDCTHDPYTRIHEEIQFYYSPRIESIFDQNLCIYFTSIVDSAISDQRSYRFPPLNDILQFIFSVIHVLRQEFIISFPFQRKFYIFFVFFFATIPFILHYNVGSKGKRKKNEEKYVMERKWEMNNRKKMFGNLISM